MTQLLRCAFFLSWRDKVLKTEINNVCSTCFWVDALPAFFSFNVCSDNSLNQFCILEMSDQKTSVFSVCRMFNSSSRKMRRMQ